MEDIVNESLTGLWEYLYRNYFAAKSPEAFFNDYDAGRIMSIGITILQRRIADYYKGTRKVSLKSLENSDIETRDTSDDILTIVAIDRFIDGLPEADKDLFEVVRANTGSRGLGLSNSDRQRLFRVRRQLRKYLAHQ